MHDCDWWQTTDDWDVFKFNFYVGWKKREKVDRDLKPTKADILSWMKSHRIETKQYRIESSQVEVKDTAARPTESKSSDWLSDWIRIRASRQDNPDGPKPISAAYDLCKFSRDFWLTLPFCGKTIGKTMGRQRIGKIYIQRTWCVINFLDLLDLRDGILANNKINKELSAFFLMTILSWNVIAPF